MCPLLSIPVSRIPGLCNGTHKALHLAEFQTPDWSRQKESLRGTRSGKCGVAANAPVHSCADHPISICLQKYAHYLVLFFLLPFFSVIQVVSLPHMGAYADPYARDSERGCRSVPRSLQQPSFSSRYSCLVFTYKLHNYSPVSPPIVLCIVYSKILQ